MKRRQVCSTVLPADHAFCKLDGTALLDAPETAEGVPQPAFLSWLPSPDKRRVPVWCWVLVGVGVFFFLMAFVLPSLAFTTLSSTRKHANEHAAILSIQAIQIAESIYQQNYPIKGYTCTLAALGGDPNAGAPTPAAAQLLKSDLSSGYKDGYIFKIRTCTKVTIKGIDRITGFTITAVPQTVGKTGNTGFCSDESGVIESDPTGGTNCTQLVQ